MATTGALMQLLDDNPSDGEVLVGGDAAWSPPLPPANFAAFPRTAALGPEGMSYWRSLPWI